MRAIFITPHRYLTADQDPPCKTGNMGSGIELGKVVSESLSGGHSDNGNYGGTVPRTKLFPVINIAEHLYIIIDYYLRHMPF